MFATRQPGSHDRSSATCCPDTASPASTTVPACPSRIGAGHPPAASPARTDGTPLTSDAGYRRPASDSRSSSSSTHPPASSGANISNTDTSKLADVEASTRDSPASPNTPAAHWTRLTTPRRVIVTPLGTPVDPDVYITYAAPSSPGHGACAGISRPGARSSSMTSTGTSPGSVAAFTRSARITAGAESASMNAFRSSGYAGSTGTYAAPACHTASMAVSSRGDRPITTATSDSGPAPRTASRRAVRSAAAASHP